MENEEKEFIGSTNDTEITVNEELEENQEIEDDHEEESVEELKKKLKTLEFKRAHDRKKIEELEKGAKTSNQANKSYGDKDANMSAFDLIAVTKANLDEDGLKEVMEYAKYKKISILEALKSPIIKATLDTREETKRIAEATNTGVTRRGSSKASDFTLLENANKGLYPESNEDIQRLLALRRAKK